MKAVFLTVPFLIWLWLHHWGNISPSIDNHWYAHWIAYHFDYLAQGIFPLWDPFRSWGWPDHTDPRFFGDLNPFFLIVSFLSLFHLPPLVSFNVFLVSFYLFGGIGFYLLVKALWEEETPALLAYAMYMFSTLGGLLFSQLTVLSMLIDSIWFYFFLISFLKPTTLRKQRGYFTGLVCSLMVVVSTYVPFFLIVSLSSILAAICLLRPCLFSVILKRTISFAKSSPYLSFFGILSVAAAVLPGLFWFMSVQHGDTVFLTERNYYGALNPLSVAYETMAHGGLASQISPGEILNDAFCSLNSYCYVPVFLVIILSLGSLSDMNPRARLLFVSVFFVFLFALAQVTPLQAFLFQHVFLFRLFRNLYFLGTFIYLGLVTLAAGQMAVYLKCKPQGRLPLLGQLTFIFLVHLGWFIFLLPQEEVPVTYYATILGSMFLFSLYFLRVFDDRKYLFLTGLIILALLGPCQIISKYSFYWAKGDYNAISLGKKEFSYRRPMRGQNPLTENGFGLFPKKREDESGFYNKGYYGSRYSYQLYVHVPAQDLQTYVSYKFVLYRAVACMSPQHTDWEALRRTLSHLDSPAWVVDKGACNDPANTAVSGQAMPVLGPSSSFKVIYFNPNEVKIRTNFPQAEFLVFNDSYFPGWSVIIDGHKQVLYRSNAAFKGVWVNPGEHRVEFKFGTASQYAFYWGELFLVFAWGICVFMLFIKNELP